LAELERSLALASPGSFALLASQGKWRAARHLAYLDQAIVESLAAAERGQQEGLVVSMPPQHGKSELCSRFLPAWRLGCHPEQRVILTSYEADFAASWGRKARDLLEQWGPLFGVRVSRRSSAANRWDLEGHDGGMMTAGVGGPITGKGAHLLIVDDPIKNDEEARSASCRQRQWEWWQSVASTRLRPGGLIVVIQTRWHRDDLTGRILEQAARRGNVWRQIKFPAIAEENDLLGRAPGEALWPEMYSAERLAQVKTGRAPYYWHALYQQNPQGEGSAEWPDEWFGPSIWFDEWPGDIRARVAALDPSKGTESKFGDYSAFALVALSRDGKCYIDADLAIRNCAVIVDTAIALQRRFQAQAFGVETNQFQQLLADQLERRGMEAGVPLPLYTINNTINKQVRIRALTPWLAQGRLRFKGDSPGARLLVEQLRDFPLGDHDDGPDALEMAIRLLCELLGQQQETTYEEVYVMDFDDWGWRWRRFC
jgi:predicted phage terminase large subunit-like protein